MKKVLLLLAVLTLFLAPVVHAEDLPNFGTCPNPGGTSVASYPDGDHGIAGDYTTHTGSDNVFQISENGYTQCFCPVDPGMGMQTKWLNASGLTQSEIDSMTSSGWIFIGNGADWGLTADPYLAMNDPFDCNPQAGGLGGGNGSTNTPTVTPAPGQAPSAPAAPTGTGGQVLGTSTSILADTGSLLILPRLIIASLVALGIFLIIVVL